MEKKDGPAAMDLESGSAPAASVRRNTPLLLRLLSPVFVQAFTMTFLAEWGTIHDFFHPLCL